MEHSAARSDNDYNLKKLLEIRNNIISVLEKHEEDIIFVTEAKSVSAEDVIVFANNFSHSLRAPKLWAPPHPLVGAGPPAPQAEQMRAGALAEYIARIGKPKNDDRAGVQIKLAETKPLPPVSTLPVAPQEAGKKRPREDAVEGTKKTEKSPQKTKAAKVAIDFGLGDSDSDTSA